jgi:hypothetical protein
MPCFDIPFSMPFSMVFRFGKSLENVIGKQHRKTASEMILQNSFGTLHWKTDLESCIGKQALKNRMAPEALLKMVSEPSWESSFRK